MSWLLLLCFNSHIIFMWNLGKAVFQNLKLVFEKFPDITSSDITSPFLPYVHIIYTIASLHYCNDLAFNPFLFNCHFTVSVINIFVRVIHIFIYTGYSIAIFSHYCIYREVYFCVLNKEFNCEIGISYYHISITRLINIHLWWCFSDEELEGLSVNNNNT